MLSNKVSKLVGEILSPNIKLLGDILGEVLTEQSSEDIFNLEERIRFLSKEYREKGDEKAIEELESEIKKLTPTEQSVIIRAFSHFFSLANLAEEYYKVQSNKIKSIWNY